MNVIYQFLTFLVVLGIIVLVHELGHYIAARLMKIRVEVFSFGFGKRLFGRKVGDTDFRVSLFPVGGYVRMAGEEEVDAEHPSPDQFMAKNRAQKIFVLVMGPLMNLVLALVLIIGINMGGVEIDSYKLEKPVIGYVVKGSPAEKAGLLPGDTLLAIQGRKTPDWKEVEITIGTNPKENVKIDFLRAGAAAEHRAQGGDPFAHTRSVTPVFTGNCRPLSTMSSGITRPGRRGCGPATASRRSTADRWPLISNWPT